MSILKKRPKEETSIIGAIQKVIEEVINAFEVDLDF